MYDPGVGVGGMCPLPPTFMESALFKQTIYRQIVCICALKACAPNNNMKLYIVDCTVFGWALSHSMIVWNLIYLKSVHYYQSDQYHQLHLKRNIKVIILSNSHVLLLL